MHVPILVEPVHDGIFRATAGAPFGLSAEGTTADEAVRHLEVALRARLTAGAQLRSIDLGQSSPPPPWMRPLTDDEKWAFDTMNEAIAENRRREAEAEP